MSCFRLAQFGAECEVGDFADGSDRIQRFGVPPPLVQRGWRYWSYRFIIRCAFPDAPDRAKTCRFEWKPWLTLRGSGPDPLFRRYKK